MLDSKTRKIKRRQSITYEMSIFNIINVGSNQALRAQSKNKKKQDNITRIMGTIHNQQSISQLWMLNYLSNDKYEIVNYETDDVIDTEEQQVKLERGKSKWTQKIDIQVLQYGSMEQMRYVKLRDSNGYFLTLDGILTLSKDTYEEDFQKFRLIPVEKPFDLKGLDNSYNIMQLPKCLDAQNATKIPGYYIVLFKANRRGNQRWIFDPPLKPDSKQPYRIQNFVTRLFLDIDEKDMLMQVKGDNEYIWILEKQGSHHQYYILCKKNGLYLDSNQDGYLIFKKKDQQPKKWSIITWK